MWYIHSNNMGRNFCQVCVVPTCEYHSSSPPLVMEYVFIYSGIEGGRVVHHSLVCRCICDNMTFLLPQTDLTDVDMEDDMKHIVSDEIRRFRQSYKVSNSPTHALICITLQFLFICVNMCVYVHVTAFAACGKGICLVHHTNSHVL